MPSPQRAAGRAVRDVTLQIAAGEIHGDLVAPSGAVGLVVFAHGSGSSRHSPRNRSVASTLQDAGIATLLLDLLTVEEERIDLRTAEYRFDIPRLAERLVAAIDQPPEVDPKAAGSIGLFGASTGGAAALIAAASRPERVRGVVLRGARSDLAGGAVRKVTAPTLLLVGEEDPEVRRLNEATFKALPGEKELVVIRGASHLFEEPGTLEEVAARSRDWFVRYLPARG
jgi:putative phosphoribosyl transferase